MKTLILDNYDSFTFNLYQYIAELGGNPEVHRNDRITIEDVRKGGYTHLVISPGPGNPYTPRDIGISDELIDYAEENGIPLLGVCLGLQVLVRHLGGEVVRAPEAMHGKSSFLTMEERGLLFDAIQGPIEVMRYHSLCASERVPDVLRVTARTADPQKVIMAVEHRTLPIHAVQFHPESIGTLRGKEMLQVFLSLS